MIHEFPRYNEIVSFESLNFISSDLWKFEVETFVDIQDAIRRI